MKFHNSNRTHSARANGKERAGNATHVASQVTTLGRAQKRNKRKVKMQGFAIQYKGGGKCKGKGSKDFRGKCLSCVKKGHPAAERKGKGKSKRGKINWNGKGKCGAYSSSMYPQDDTWRSTTWNDYNEAWGAEAAQETSTAGGTAASITPLSYR